MTQKQLPGVSWKGCVIGGLSVCTTRVRKLLGNAGASQKQPALLFITSHFYFSHRDTQQFTPRESSKFSSSLRAAIGWTVPTWQTAIGWQRERTWALKRQTAVQSRQEDHGCCCALWDNVHLEYDTVFLQWSFYKLMCIQFSIESEGVCFHCFMIKYSNDVDIALGFRLKTYETYLKSCFISHGAGRPPHELCHVDITWPASSWPVANNASTLHKITCK